MNFKKCKHFPNHFFSSEKKINPEIRKEDPKVTFSYQHSFWQDHKSKHPRLDNCLGLFPLDEDDDWFIMNDGTLHHVNHSITNDYCIEVLKVHLSSYN